LDRRERKLGSDLESISAEERSDRIEDLGALAEMYLQADSYGAALEALDRALAEPDLANADDARRASLEAKAVLCLRLQGRHADAASRGLAVLASLTSSVPATLRVPLQLEVVDALTSQSRYEEARALAQQALEAARPLGDPELMGRTLSRTGILWMRLGDWLLAKENLEEARSYFLQIGDEEKIANLHATLGVLHKNLCEWAIAVHHLRDALARDRRLGRFAKVANRLQNLGIVYLKSGEWAKAHDAFVEARQIYRQVGDQVGLAATALSLGTHARLVGRLDDAERLLTEALERALGGGWAREEALAREFLGDLAFDRGDTRRAVESYRGALAIAERIAPTGDIVTEVLRRLGEAYLVLGDVPAAQEAIERCRKVCGLLDDRYEGAVLHRVHGLLHAASGDRESATHEWQTGVNLLGEMGERYERGRVLFLLAQHVTEPGEARKLSYRASACFAEVGAETALAAVEKWLHAQGSAGETVPAGDPRRPRLAARRQAEKAGLVGVSKGLSRVLDLIDRAARTDLTVIVVGQTGTGKELVARAIHERGDRAQRPFLPVNCGALRSDLALSQLFGHRRGAFTGAHTEGTGLVEAAHTGTLFLDEVGELPLDVQVTLLRFLERGDYIRLGETTVRHADVRVIGATHVDLRRAVAEGRFRADLFYRLYEIEIGLPPLAERKEDVLPLVHHFLRLYAGEAAPRLSPDAAALLTGYNWPGNIRELENSIRRALALRSEGPLLEADDLIVHLDQLPSAEGFAVTGSLDERSELLAALDRAGGNKSRAADLLGVSRKTLYQRMRRLGIPLEGSDAVL